jgi:Ni,Fe-hydrogenase I large subunit
MKARKMIVFSPFTRVEGDLRLGVEIGDGVVVSACASGTLFRNFENLLRGREPRDAIVILCRICGQCGVAHSRAAAEVLAKACSVTPPRNGVLSATVIQATETLLSHLAHFYFSFAADLCGLPGCGHLEDRFSPIRGNSFRKALKTRQVLLGLMGLFAGKWPNTLTIQPGGVTKPLNRGEIIRAKGILAEFVRCLESEMLGCSLERWLENRSLSHVESWLGEGDHEQSDIGVFISTALKTGLERIGRGPSRFLSTGGLLLPGGATWLRSGYWDGGTGTLDQRQVTEDVAFSWFESGPKAVHPYEGTTDPAPDKAEAYSWAKAPRYAGKSVEVGPMARMVIDGDPLAVDLIKRRGPSVFARQLLRLHEVVRLVKSVGEWLDEIDSEEPFCAPFDVPDSAEGMALTEAPRGTLGHWMRVEKGRVRSYQVITPTSWNLSPRDRSEAPGPLEEALVGTPVMDPDRATNVALVVRSYDPCLYCSVH